MRRTPSVSTKTCSTAIRMVYTLYSTTGANKNLPSITKIIPYKYRTQAIQKAEEVLTDYFHNTRALPFTYAEHISKNSRHCLYDLVSRVPFTSPTLFKNSFQRFLRYNPINEFGFFYESIGIHYVDITGFLRPNLHFLCDDSGVLEAAFCLAGFGFPWGVLGRLYVEEVSIFRKNGKFLKERLDGLVSLGFENQQVIGFCLAFPGLLMGEEADFGGDFGLLLDDLKRVFEGFDLGRSRVVGNVEVWFEVCRKVRFFYDLGVAKGEVGKLIGESKCDLSDYPEAVLVEKVEFFTRLGLEKAEVGVLILSNPSVLSVKIQDRLITVSSILDHFGLPKQKLLSVKQSYGYVFGRNKMVNLPNILRAMDLHEWFCDSMKCGYHSLFHSYELSGPDDGVDEKYVQNLESIRSGRTRDYSFGKLDFFHGIGFGENSFTVRLLVDVHGSPNDLQDRFDFLLNEGIEFSKLCKIMSRAPKLLNQEIDSLKKKLDFFVEEIGLPLNYLDSFPAYLLYNLEKRIKPRFGFHVWLTEQGWCTKKYSLSSIIAVSNKSFVEQLSRIHPAAPRLWLEKYGNRKIE
ncbi:hypothetical protein vseg_018924 [Gypsophila vaccaria]